MVVLLLLYYLLLEREKTHRFNRYYLLAALPFSLVIPFITIPVYVNVTAVQLQPDVLQPVPNAVALTFIHGTIQQDVNYLPYIMWSLYGIVTAILAFRFIKNLWLFSKLIAQSETLPYKNAMLVLVNDAIVPHTFLNYIFINKDEYQNRSIEPELFAHELAHVTQKHTHDILFIEALKTLMWFNPLLYLYKRAIQLNHEFLADENVLTQTNNVITYQQLLLQRATPRTSYALASSLNFGITKKRFSMMTKTTKKNKALLLKLAALPVLAGLVYGLSTETVAKETPYNDLLQYIAREDSLKQSRDTYYSNVRVVVDDKVKGMALNKMYEELTDAEKDRYMFDVPLRLKKKQPTAKELESYKDKKTYAVWIDGKNVDNSALNNYKPEDIALFTGS
ncbi:MAG: M56 family metallopeptidase, partial [Bacteroidota bacterium]